MDMETLQDNFAALTDVYNTVVDLYNNEGIEPDGDIEDLLNQTKEVIEEVGELDENDFDDEADMKKINDTMVTLLEALGGIVDSMSYADDEDDNPELAYVDGVYANDGNGRDFIILFYTSDDGEYAYVHDGTEEAIAQYTVEDAELDDGTEYEVVTVGGLSIGYIDDGDDVYIVDMDDGTIYAASHLTEDEAEGFYSILNDD
ncbi:MAG: hypothetical protein IKW90_12235 [Lachnospiraceae bacterium]|nr:hypothetical protein [Lachnospiraceae bacterium]